MQTLHRNYSYKQPGSRIAVAPNKRRFPVKSLLVLITIVVVLLIAKSVLASNGDNPPPQVQSAKATAQQPVKEEPKRMVDMSGLEPILATTIKQYPYDTSVSVIELNSGTIVQSGDTYPFLAASTTKLLTAMLYLNNTENGQESLSNQIGDKSAQVQLHDMINKSDNTAWQLLNDHLSRESLTVYAKKQGITSYDSTKNTVTSNDMASLLAKLYKREVLNEEHTKLLLSWMQNTTEERFIPPAVPATSQLYHKSGYLEDRVHDVAIIDNGVTPFAIVIYSKSYGNAPYNYQTARKLFSEVTTKVVSVFNQ